MPRIEIHDLEICVVTDAPARRGGRIVGVTGYDIYYWVNPFVKLTPEKRAELEGGYKAKYPEAKFADELVVPVTEATPPAKPPKSAKPETDGDNKA